MTADLEGKVIAITGGGSGLGRAASRLAAQSGASLVLGDLSKEGLDTSADAILSDGGKVSTLEMDVRDPADCQRWPSWPWRSMAALMAPYAVLASAAMCRSWR